MSAEVLYLIPDLRGLKDMRIILELRGMKLDQLTKTSGGSKV